MMYRYAVFIHGTNYDQPHTDIPEHAIMCTSLADVRLRLEWAAYGNPRGVTGTGDHTLDTPGYGDPGDGAYVYRVDVDDPQYALPLDLPVGHARHAWQWTDFSEVAYYAEFGPRGGIRLTPA